MKRWLSSAAVVLLLFAGFGVRAYAAGEHEAEAPAHEAKAEGGHEEGAPHDVPGFILHHLADSHEYELEIPWPHTEGITFHVSDAFEFLKFEREPGACARPISPGFAAFPGLGSFSNGCYDLRPTKAVLMMWIAAVVLLGLMFLTRRKKDELVPSGRGQHVVEVLALFVRDEIVVPNIGKAEAPRYTPYLTSVFFFILAMNWLGLIPDMATPTGNMAITAGMAILTFLLTQVAAIRAAGLGGFLKHLTGGVHWAMWPIMIPVEILGLFTKPFALTVRLFANMLAGHTVLFFLLGLIFLLHPAFAVASVPMAMAIYLLEIFVGLVQAYIFVVLSALFIGQGVAMGHHAHAHAEEHH